MGLNIAANHTHVAAGETDFAIASEGSITVYGITVQGTANGQVVVEEGDGSTVIQEISVLANTTAVMNIPFVAARGLNITTPASVTCTVFHSNVT